MSTTSSSNVVDGEIEAAFAAGAMPPEWRRLLLASGLNGNDVNVIAASIANTHLIILRTTWSSTQKMAFIALGVMGVLFLCLVVVVVFRETMGLMVTLLAVGVFYVGAGEPRRLGRSRELFSDTICFLLFDSHSWFRVDLRQTTKNSRCNDSESDAACGSTSYKF